MGDEEGTDSITEEKAPMPAKDELESRRHGLRGVMSRDLEENFKKGVFILLSIFIVLAAFGLYSSVGSIIDRWVEYQYVPIVRTIYYIAVIAICIYLIKSNFLKK